MRRARLTIACYAVGGLLASAARLTGWTRGGDRRGLDPYGRLAAVLFTVLHKWPLQIAKRW